MNWEEDPVSDDFLRMNELMASALTIPYEDRVKALTEASHLHADNVWLINTGFFVRPFIKSDPPSERGSPTPPRDRRS